MRRVAGQCKAFGASRACRASGTLTAARLLGGARGALFDLFGTLAEVDARRLPVLPVGGRDYASTLPLLCQEIAACRPELGRDQILHELLVTTVAGRRKGRADYREHSSRKVFDHLLARLSLPPGEERRRLAASLSDVQLRAVAGALRPLPGARQLLESLRGRGLRIALVSNLDHSSGAPLLLAAAGLEGLFDAVVLSEDVGFCKPDRRPFQAALAALGLSPADVFYVGDEAVADVWGAGRVGLRTIWLNRTGRPYPERRFPPSLICAGLEELVPMEIQPGPGAPTSHSAGGVGVLAAVELDGAPAKDGKPEREHARPLHVERE
jgi:HAD superfamily hydrolase (TIGR01509 family)